jgi:hypothetical protein
MPEAVRWTEIERPVIAALAAGVGVPGQTLKEYDAALV